MLEAIFKLVQAIIHWSGVTPEDFSLIQDIFNNILEFFKSLSGLLH